MWEGCTDKLKAIPSTVSPLSCGDMHKAKWGITGYDNPAHWCAKGKTSFGI